MPSYQHASFAGESLVLENTLMRVEIHKRLTGWGWAEIFTPEGKCMGVLEHFGEIMLRDQEIPMRLEAQQVRQSRSDKGETLTLSVRSLVVKDKLKGTSFENWLHYPLTSPCLEGEVTMTLDANAPILYLSFHLTSKANQYARYVRGPWLKVGEGSFANDKTDAIFPGVEWLLGQEWSSGTDWFKDPWAKRFAPHPNKVAIPVLALSHEGYGIGLAWNPNQHATGWFNYRRQVQQPVFASPNFIDRRNHHLMGLMLPDAEVEASENQVLAEPPFELHHEQQLEFEAEVFLASGNSLDVIVDYLKRHGLPQPRAPRWPLEDALHRIARAYNTHLWHEGRGFGTLQTPDSISPHRPGFARRYLERYPDSPFAAMFQERLSWCQTQTGYTNHLPLAERGLTQEELFAIGHDLLTWQRPDGAFPFDPKGRHYHKDDFVVATTYLEPMGHAGDSALGITVLPVFDLLYIGQATQDTRFYDAARKALDYCLPMQRPEGGDYWETPLHSPNLLAAGHAAVAYYLGYQHFKDKSYLDKAIYWMRAILPFTHLWDNQIEMLYNTKPCLCSSDWYFANWVRDHVQWEVLKTFALCDAYGIDWAKVDPEIDWQRYHLGITTASLRWMLDHQDRSWLPHNLPESLTLYRQGLLDDCYADTHNSTTGNYGGMAILPDVIAVNLLALLDKQTASTEETL